MNSKKRALKRQKARLHRLDSNLQKLVQPQSRITIEFVPDSKYDYKFYKKMIEMSGATVTNFMVESIGC